MNIIEHLNDSTYEYLIDVLETTRKSNPAYDEAAGERDGLYTIELERTPGVKPYVFAQRKAEDMEYEILYYQGYCDCIRLLQFLNILPPTKQSSAFDASASVEPRMKL